MTEKKRRVIAGICIVCGVVFIGAGTVRGESDTVFRKAVNICMECIGIG